MNPYVFMTDSDSDLPCRYVDELDISMVYMPYMLDGKEYFDDLGRSGRQKEYFDNMRAGAAPVTSLLPTAAYVEYFEPCFKDGKDILFVAFSSQLSGTINNVYAARDELLARYPDRRMTVVDTLSISAMSRNAALRPRTLSELTSLPSLFSVMMGLRSSMVPTVAAIAPMRPPRRRYLRSSTVNQAWARILFSSSHRATSSMLLPWR